MHPGAPLRHVLDACRGFRITARRPAPASPHLPNGHPGKVEAARDLEAQLAQGPHAALPALTASLATAELVGVDEALLARGRELAGAVADAARAAQLEEARRRRAAEARGGSVR